MFCGRPPYPSLFAQEWSAPSVVVLLLIFSAGKVFIPFLARLVNSSLLAP